VCPPCNSDSNCVQLIKKCFPFMELEHSLPCSQEPVIGLCQRIFLIFFHLLRCCRGNIFGPNILCISFFSLFLRASAYFYGSNDGKSRLADSEIGLELDTLGFDASFDIGVRIFNGSYFMDLYLVSIS
jgi:hypothetical protein